MAVEWRHLIFGDVDSADYGIYISGDGVYNAPERAVEFVDVPGRNGAIALDQGRYNNIEITYPAGTFAKTQEEFRENLSAFRNAILSQKGYQRLEDTYHPEEYRMGLYSAGLEVSPVGYSQAGEFELIFNCKPQRWLTVGAYPIPVDSGDVLENPTPFDSGPLLEITGYGSVSFNGHTVELENAVLGPTLVLESFYASGVSGAASISHEVIKELNKGLFNTGDTITVNASKFQTQFYSNNVRCYVKSQSGSGASEGSGAILWNDDPAMSDIQISFTDINFTAGTSATKTYTYTATYQNQSNVEIGSIQLVATIAYSYSSQDDTHFLTFTIEATAVSGTYPPRGIYIYGGKTTVDSSLSILGNPTYIDCDLGEAYRLSDGTPVSLNSKVVLGSDLPALAPGSNKIIFSNTITDLKIAPRWWRI